MRAVLLDMLGTLVRLEPPVPRLREELRRRTGVDVGEEAAARGFAAEISYYLAHHLEGRDPEALEGLRDRCAAELHAALGVEGIERRDVRAAMMAALSFAPFPDAAPALRELRARGLRLVVASNWDCSLPHWLAAVGLDGLVDGWTSSAVVGAPKPAPDVFRAALRLAGVAPSEAVHVGDSLENDVNGARVAGVRPVLLARETTPPPEVPAIRSLAEVASVL